MLIGDTVVGKSSLMLRYTRDKFYPKMGPTMFLDFGTKTVEVEDTKIKERILDVCTFMHILNNIDLLNSKNRGH